MSEIQTQPDFSEIAVLIQTARQRADQVYETYRDDQKVSALLRQIRTFYLAQLPPEGDEA